MDTWPIIILWWSYLYPSAMMKQKTNHWKRKNFLVMNDFILIRYSSIPPSTSVASIIQIAVRNNIVNCIEYFYRFSMEN